MEVTSLIIICVVIIVLSLVLRRIFWQEEGRVSLSLMQQQIDGLRSQVELSINNLTQRMNERMGEMSQLLQDTHRTIGTRLDASAQTVKELYRSIGQLDEASRRIFEVGKDISSLEEILRAPKLRGGLGELLLADLLSQILPKDRFTLQYSFKNGAKVDAVIHLGDGFVPVDSKFPLENFRKLLGAKTDEERRQCQRLLHNDVRHHIDEIASKYILPDEGTYDFALMYIPAENLYYELIIHDEGSQIHSYGLSKRVIPVSPNSFYAYLMTILLGLRGMRIEESAKEIITGLGRLRQEFDKFHEDFEILGRHLLNTRNKYEDISRRIIRVTEQLQRIEGPKDSG